MWSNASCSHRWLPALANSIKNLSQTLWRCRVDQQLFIKLSTPQTHFKLDMNSLSFLEFHQRFLFTSSNNLPACQTTPFLSQSPHLYKQWMLKNKIIICLSFCFGSRNNKQADGKERPANSCTESARLKETKVFRIQKYSMLSRLWSSAFITNV